MASIYTSELLISLLKLIGLETRLSRLYVLYLLLNGDELFCRAERIVIIDSYEPPSKEDMLDSINCIFCNTSQHFIRQCCVLHSSEVLRTFHLQSFT